MKRLFVPYIHVIEPRVPRPVAGSNSLSVVSYRLIVTIGDSIDRGVDGFRRWRERRATVAALSALDAHLLRDIGLHRSDVVQTLTQGVVFFDELNDGRARRAWSRSVPSVRVLVDRVTPISAGATGPSKPDALANGNLMTLRPEPIGNHQR